MNRILAVLLLATAACSGLPDAGNGIVALEVRTPDPAALSLLPGESVTLHARALNLQGDSVAAEILWVTADTGVIALDALQGIVTSRSDTAAIARVQASVGSLRSSLITITLRAAPAGARVP